PHQEQYDENDDDEPEAAAAVITGAIKRAAADTAEAAEQCNDENNQDNGADRHVTSSARWALVYLVRGEPCGNHESSALRCDIGGIFLSNEPQLHVVDQPE